LQGSDFLNFYEESELEILYFYEKFTNWNQLFFLNPKNLEATLIFSPTF
jgi:hypothetical protein